MGRARGRDAELAAVLDALGRGEHVVLTGEPGIGKSLLWRESLAGVDSRRVLRVVATSTTQPIPLGALAPVLRPRTRPGALDPLDRLVAAIDALRSEPDPPLLAVDDAHLLDDLSAAALVQVAVEGLATLLATVRDGAPAPDAVRRLQKDELAVVVPLAPLDARGVAAMVEDITGRPVEQRTHSRLHDASRGNPLFLRELVLAGLAQGAFADVGGVLAWTGELAAGPTLSEVIAARLAALDPAVRECAEAVAIAGTVPAAILERVSSPLVVAAALRAGAVRTRVENGRAVIEPGHPLYTPVLLAATSTQRSSEVLDALVDAAMARRPRDSADEVRIASWLVARADRAHPELLLAAARRAFDATDVHLAERLAVAAVDAGAGPEAEVLLHRVGAVLGRGAPAPAATAGTDENTLVQEAMAGADAFFFGFGSAGDALRGVERALGSVDDTRRREELSGVALSVRLHSGDCATDVAAEGLRLIEAATHPAGVLRAALAAGPALAVAGRPGDAVEVLRRGRAAIPDAGVAAFLGDQVCFTLAQALVLQGDLATAEEQAACGHADAIAADDMPSIIGWAIVTGQIDLWRGRPRSAARRFGEALAIMGDIDLVGYRARCLADASHALAWAGELDAGVSPPQVPAPGSNGAFFAPLVLVSLAERSAALGNLAGAEALAAEAAERAETSGQPLVAALALHVAQRVRPSKKTAARARVLLAGVQGDLGALLADSAAALCSGDGVAMEACASRWIDSGAVALGAELLARASTAFGTTGAYAAARRCRAAALDAGARAEAPPPLAHLPASGIELTAREREVATLAGKGLTNAEIADSLGLSVRTVHTHLQVTYRKLGMNRRERLADLLG